MKVQLLFFPGCPNADAAREVLSRALLQVGCPPDFDSVDLTASDTPDALRHWGSPTVLVNGIDVAGERTPTGPSCRLYEGTPAGSRGIPPIGEIVRAISRARRPRFHWLRSLAVLPGVALSLVPAASCPACLAAYTGVMSAVGLGFLASERVLAPLILLFLAIDVADVAWSTKGHRQPGPLTFTILGSVAVILGRLVWSVPAVLYGGITLLLGASLWNLWTKRPPQHSLIQLRLERKGVSS